MIMAITDKDTCLISSSLQSVILCITVIFPETWGRMYRLSELAKAAHNVPSGDGLGG